jgi:hypothetical protein
MGDSTAGIGPSEQRAARIAGATYLVSVALIVYANFGMRGPLLDYGDMAETLKNVGAAPLVFRLSVGADLAYCLGIVVILGAFYHVLSGVHRYAALVAAGWKLLYGATAVLTALTYLDIVRLATRPAVDGPSADLLGAAVQRSLAAISDQYYLGLTCWALSATAFYWLWYRSRLVPATLAACGMVGSIWCAACAVSYLVAPGFGRVVNVWAFDLPMVGTDVVLSVWLVTKGLGKTAVAPGANLPTARTA